MWPSGLAVDDLHGTEGNHPLLLAALRQDRVAWAVVAVDELVLNLFLLTLQQGQE